MDAAFKMDKGIGNLFRQPQLKSFFPSEYLHWRVCLDDMGRLVGILALFNVNVGATAHHKQQDRY